VLEITIRPGCFHPRKATPIQYVQTETISQHFPTLDNQWTTCLNLSLA